MWNLGRTRANYTREQKIYELLVSITSPEKCSIFFFVFGTKSSFFRGFDDKVLLQKEKISDREEKKTVSSEPFIDCVQL